ncbi:MAG: helix-turn-helix domain-containing protein [Alphaproteobacteria bacterium]|nr:helix-turn-helix domain-containing protein [Alphaproteobacteria bacterium]
MSKSQHQNSYTVSCTGQDLRAWRKELGFTQAELSIALRISRPTLSTLENQTDQLPMIYRLAIHALKNDPSLLSTIQKTSKHGGRRGD